VISLVHSCQSIRATNSQNKVFGENQFMYRVIALNLFRSQTGPARVFVINSIGSFRFSFVSPISLERFDSLYFFTRETTNSSSSELLEERTLRQHLCTPQISISFGWYNLEFLTVVKRCARCYEGPKKGTSFKLTIRFLRAAYFWWMRPS
jgi:hypothetical protein